MQKVGKGGCIVLDVRSNKIIQLFLNRNNNRDDNRMECRK